MGVVKGVNGPDLGLDACCFITMLSSTSPHPGLLAVLLVGQLRSGSGAEIAFHYPPDPLQIHELQFERPDPNFEESSSSDSDSESSSDDNRVQLPLRNKLNPAQYSKDDRLPSNEDDETPDRNSSRKDDRPWKPSWEPLLGLGEDGLVSLLAPGREWHKRKFEFGINDLTFVGRPIFARRNGRWTKRRGRKNNNLGHNGAEPSSDAASEPEQQDTPNGPLEGAADEEDTPPGTKSSLTMFNVIFVISAPPLEQTLGVKEMYDNVVRKFSKILKLEQSRTEYVSKEFDLLHALKAAHFTTKSSTSAYYSEALKQSSLAQAISNIQKSISASRIAAINLSPTKSAFLQIPPATSSSHLPSLLEPPLQPGLWLTTIHSQSVSDLDTAAPSSALQASKSLTILLRDSPERITHEIQSLHDPLAVPLTNFISAARPTKSFYKLSLASGIPLPDIHLLSHQLINWRRAIAIPPLHHRDTYIVSPNADMHKLVEASRIFENTFPMLPSLPRLLSLLSRTPAPFGTLIPSSDHKEEYYRALAWLMRGGWTTQLRTFAFVLVDPHVKKAVQEKVRGDRRERSGVQPQSEKSELGSSQGSDFRMPGVFNRPDLVSRPSSDGTTTSSRQSITSTTASNAISRAHKHNPNHASLVLSPLRASAVESKWLSQIVSTLNPSASPAASDFSATEKMELQRYWPLFVKYFNGSEALESIPIREGLKRKFMWDLLGKMGLDFDGGVQKKEDNMQQNSRIMVALRHW